MIRLKILAILFVFMLGSMAGWVLELFFRHFTSPDRKWVNPGYLTGPYLPIYGFGVTFLFVVSYFTEQLNLSGPLFLIIVFVVSAFVMTMLELVGGLFFLKYANMRLWDYSDIRYNYKGVICLPFTILWGVGSLFYYFLVNPLVIRSLEYLFANLDMSFFVGLMMGFFIVDLWTTAAITPKLRKIALEAQTVFQYDNFKHHIAQIRSRADQKTRFFVKPSPHYVESALKEYLRRVRENGFTDRK